MLYWPICRRSPAGRSVSALGATGVVVLAVLGGCGGGGGGGNSGSEALSPGPFAISVTVKGLDGRGLILQNNSGDDLAVSANGNADFSTWLSTGQAYSVTVKTQPTLLTQRCTVSGGSGTVSGGPVAGILVECVSPSTPYLYVANSAAHSVAGFKVDAVDGTLSSIEVRASDGLNSPAGIATDPEGRFLYLTNAADTGSAALNAYAIGATVATAGSLTPLGQIASAGNPAGIVISPEGRHAYVLGTTLGAGHARGFSIQTGGGLSAISGSPATVGATPTAVAIDPKGRFVYVSNNGAATISVLARDSSTGVLTATSTRSTGAQPTGLAVDPTGRWLYVANAGASALTTYAIDAATVALSLVEAKSLSNSPFDVAVHPKGTHVYAVFKSANHIAAYRVNDTTGALTDIPGAPPLSTGLEPSAVRVDGAGRYLYVANKQSNTLSIFSISASTGALTLVGTPSGGTGTAPVGLALVIR